MNAVDIVIRFEKENFEMKSKALVAFYTESKKIICVGDDCEKYLELDGVSVVSPFEEGKIADYHASVALIKILLEKAFKESGKKLLLKKQYIGLCTGGKVNEVERKAMEDCIYQSGFAKDLFICEMSYAKMMEKADLFPDFKSPNVMIEIGSPDLRDVVNNSVKKAMELAKEQGIEKKEVIKMFEDALNL